MEQAYHNSERVLVKHLDNRHFILNRLRTPSLEVFAKVLFRRWQSFERMAQAQDSLLEIEDNGGCNADCGEEGVGAAAVTRGDPAPVLEPGGHVLDFVPLAINRLVIRKGDLAAPGRRNAWLDAFSRQVPHGTSCCHSLGPQSKLSPAAAPPARPVRPYGRSSALRTAAG